MDRQIDEAETQAPGTTPGQVAGKQPPRYGHLMCRTTLWGLAGFLGCAYFTWLSFIHVSRHEYDWPHETWTAATYVVWILLLAGLALDTRCWRENLFFGTLGVNFLIGFALTIWSMVPPSDVRTARIVTGVLWGLAGLVSLSTTVGRAGRVEEP